MAGWLMRDRTTRATCAPVLACSTRTRCRCVVTLVGRGVHDSALSVYCADRGVGCIAHQMRVSLVVDPPSGNEMVRVYSRDGPALPTSAAIPRFAPEAPPQNVEPSASGTEPTPIEVAASEGGIRHAGDDAVTVRGEGSVEMPATNIRSSNQSPSRGKGAPIAAETAAAAAAAAAASEGRETTTATREHPSEIRSPSPTLPPPVVFIHGIMGSRLDDGSGSTQFLTPSHALGLHSPSLALPTNWCVLLDLLLASPFILCL
jgi:hypothetical protein